MRNPFKFKHATSAYEKKHRSKNSTWCVHIGYSVTGTKEVRNFPTKEEAETFRHQWNSRLASKAPAALEELSEISQQEVRLALARCKVFNISLLDAVDFAIRHARPPKGQITIEEAIRIWEQKKTQGHRKAKYIKNSDTYYKPFARAFPNRELTSITRDEAERYLNRHRTWSPVTTRFHNQYLNSFYRFHIREGYASLNPLETIEKPQERKRFSELQKVISVNDACKLLEWALLNGYKAECAAMALVLFCGVRVDEVERLQWENIRFENRKVDLQEAAAKASRRRVNEIPENALHWLTLCKDSGRIAPHNYSKRMQRLRKRAKISYRQNMMRHSFSAYHMAKYQNAAKTAFILGHPNQALLYRTYFDLVTPEEAERYFGIVPKQIALELDLEAKRAAEAESNCGTAFKDEDGKWKPVTDPNKVEEDIFETMDETSF